MNLSELGRKIRLSVGVQSFVLLLLAASAVARQARGDSFSAELIAAFLVIYLIVRSTWAHITAQRILHVFCVESTEEIARLKEEVERLKSIVENGSRPRRGEGE